MSVAYPAGPRVAPSAEPACTAKTADSISNPLMQGKQVTEKVKLAISSAESDPSSAVDQRFGRCQYLVIVDAGSGDRECLPNPNIDAAGGAGIRTAQMAVDRGAQAVITGNVGPKAMDVLASSGITVYTGFSGTVEEAIQAFEKGELETTLSPTVEENFGTRAGSGQTPSPPAAGMPPARPRSGGGGGPRGCRR